LLIVAFWGLQFNIITERKDITKHFIHKDIFLKYTYNSCYLVNIKVNLIA